jgi:hypothetical protein
MTDEKKFLRVVRDLKKEMIVIEGDYNGLLSLYENIGSLLDIKEDYLKDNKLIESDFMTPELGGEGLNGEEPVDENWTLVGHLRIYRWED